MKNTSSRERLPRQEERENGEYEAEETEQPSGIGSAESDVHRPPPLSESTNFASLSRATSAPWLHGSRSKQTRVDWKPAISEEIRALIMIFQTRIQSYQQELRLQCSWKNQWGNRAAFLHCHFSGPITFIIFQASRSVLPPTESKSSKNSYPNFKK